MTLVLDADTQDKLDRLSQALGFTREMAAVYAIRLTAACAEEGLIADIPAWPEEARLLTGTGGKVIDFAAPRGK